MEQPGKLLVVIGVVIVGAGLLMIFGEKLPFRLGRLPLDFHYQRGKVSFYLPLGTSILVSLALTLIFSLLNRR